MCGIVGVFTTKQDDAIDQAVEKMVTSLSHRGPDNHGVWADINSGIYFGHRRLSIIDLTESGHQPKHSSCGRYVIVFNGEIYNHNKLRSELESENAQFNWKGHSDTETILACVSSWGIKQSLNKMVGMFAISIWDKKLSKLYLARDRFGEKPLYYGWTDNDFVFTSELKALKKYFRFTPVIDRDVLSLYMRFNYVPIPYSIYKNIYKLEPGCLLSISLGATKTPPPSVPMVPFKKSGFSISKWWSLKNTIENQANSLITNEETAINNLENVLIDSIKLQSISDVPIGAFLSGGIDSSSIVALMQNHVSSSPVKTFTIGFNESAHNEAIYAKDVAKHLGTDHTEIYLSSSDTLDVIPSLPDLYDEPFADSSQIPTYLVSKIASSDVKVVLSGDGGDEMFGGYNRYFWAQRIWNKISWLPKPARILMSYLITTVSPVYWDSFIKPLNIMLSSRNQVNLFGDKLHKLAVRLKTVDDLNDLYFSLVSEWSKPNGYKRSKRAFIYLKA